MAHFIFGSALMMAVLVIFSLKFAKGGYEGFHCPDGPNLRYPCTRDCQMSHNALYGFCGLGNDFNCYCSRPLTTSVAKGVQCRDKFNSNYDVVCRTDCLCNHAALSSKCNYVTHACECLGQNPNPTVRNDTLCPFQRHQDYEQFVVDLKLPYFPKSITEPMYPGGSVN